MTSPKRIVYLTGTRADFGLMLPTLRAIDRSPHLELELLVTGMHLSDRFGRTEREVEAAGLKIGRRIPVPIDDDSGHGMGVSTGLITCAVADYLAETACDVLLLLGDRGEMLAAATAGLFADVPIVHVAGGDRSGSVDESIRHAISKLAHIHCVSNEDARQRLIRMGEDPDRIFDVGAPGLVGLKKPDRATAAMVRNRYGIDDEESFVLVLFHPVVQQAAEAGAQWRAMFDALAGLPFRYVALMPNADHGTTSIRTEIEAMRDAGQLTTIDHMPRADYLALLAECRFLIGNSSSGIVEAATFGTPVVNVGDRQFGRLRSANVFDAPPESGAIGRAIEKAIGFDPQGLRNVYGDPHADIRICEILEKTDFSASALRMKTISY
ncbi:UDP-N-acetylglucosamine 2-epimerase [Sphingopyxis alaskensis]|uniref:UDP-N-acetylglucosamine 2-epimerase n=1 Tax=Sphingopyxis alaskensis (strain DSM 13593 / LMG 18877 / RB2256) TaxID=317655 RepID=Q1GST4_SPHAL|nr:UDP-N-acetylglucosamine 2-epimerase [Sphingopyxis alaskensis]ABF53288.1 UDP-N-acetylglucosamine 2-epimerase [Sphingopyxis alaskensis RB2256]MCM3418708.1 UDP-N-acetylglucosamine 2-epimerase [Sphingopyxis alaskensis]